MKRFLKTVIYFFAFTGCYSSAFTQYITNGSAKQNTCNCYTLTPAIQSQSGSVWNSRKINLTSSFDFWFTVNLGCKDFDGADGIVFILQPVSTSIGTIGVGMGFEGVSPSIGIALDTYQNTAINDPDYDHISIQANGNINHTNDLAGPVPISSTSNNVEDCQWHKLRVMWDANTKWLRAYFDGVLRVEKQVDIVRDIFSNDPNVYWGFTAATGGLSNLQQFCTALDPVIQFSANNNAACADSVVNFASASISFAPIIEYKWNFGDGTTSNLANPPPHVYHNAGSYAVQLKVKGQDGCESDSIKTIIIGSTPSAYLQVYDTCYQKQPRIVYHSSATGINYQWQVDGANTASNQVPVLTSLASGLHRLTVNASSQYNCSVPVTGTVDFTIKPKPQLQIQTTNGCINLPVSFIGVQLDQATTINQWNWNFSDRQLSNLQNPWHSFQAKGSYKVVAWAMADNGCASDSVHKVIVINAAEAYAGNDTTVVKDIPFLLHAQANGAISWLPSTGLSTTTSAQAIVNPFFDEMKYVLTVTTTEGCIATDTIRIKAMKGPTVYIPTAFTPNGDGLNDLLKPVYVGIKELKEFAVFNRWGQIMFTTNNLQKGWDGAKAWPQTYVWYVKAINYINQPVLLKGIVTLIR